MDDDDLTRWVFADVESFANAELLLPGCTPERSRQDPRAWTSGPSQKRRMDLPLFEIFSPIKRKRLDDPQRPPGPGGEANASLPVCPAPIPQAARQATHEAASKCRSPPPLPSPPRAQLPQPVSPPPSADRARKNPTPTKQLTKQPMRTALSLRVDSEGTALRAAAVAASSRRSAYLFRPVALNRQGVVTNPSGGVVALRTINQMVNRSAAQCRAKQRAATPRGSGSRSATPTPGSAPGSRPGSALGTAGSRPGSALGPAGSRPGSALGPAPPLASDPGPPASLPAAARAYPRRYCFKAL